MSGRKRNEQPLFIQSDAYDILYFKGSKVVQIGRGPPVGCSSAPIGYLSDLLQCMSPELALQRHSPDTQFESVMGRTADILPVGEGCQDAPWFTSGPEGIVSYPRLRPRSRWAPGRAGGTLDLARCQLLIINNSRRPCRACQERRGSFVSAGGMALPLKAEGL
jgi:hypothetical protein